MLLQRSSWAMAHALRVDKRPVEGKKLAGRIGGRTWPVQARSEASDNW